MISKDGTRDLVAFAPTSRQTSPLVLVVEDHEDTRSMLRTILEMEEFSVLEAVDGKAGFQMAVDQRPDIILMDLTLPVVDGIAATRAIRNHKEIGKVPIIFLSGRAEPARRQDALNAGCNDYLIKPINIDDVLHIMRRWLRRSATSAVTG